MRLRIVIAALAALVLVGTGLALGNLSVFTSPPWTSEEGFHYPTGCRIDSHGHIWIMDQSGRRLSLLDPDHGLVWQMEGGKRSGGFYTGEIKGTDASGGIWIYNTVRSQTSGVDEASELMMANPDGQLLPPVWRMDTSRVEQTAYNQLPYFHRLTKGSFYFLITDTQGNTLLHCVDTASGNEKVLRTFPGLDAYQYVSATYDPASRRGWFMDTWGAIFEWSFDGGEPVRIFDNSGSGGRRIMVPTDLYTEDGDSFVALDGKGTVFRIRRDGSVHELSSVLSSGRQWYLSSMVVQEDGTLAMANEALHEVVFWKPGKTTAPEFISLARRSGSALAWQWTVWSAAVLAVLCLMVLLVLIYLQVMRRRTPLLFKQLAIFLPLTVAAVLSGALWIQQDMMKRYVEGVETRQMVWSQLGSRLIKPEDVDALGMGDASQGEIMNSPAFSRLVKGLEDVVNNNSDPWNSSIYDYLYVNTGTDWYVFDQFSYFERYLAKPAMLEIQRSAHPGILRYEDAYSSWLSAFSPILRSDGSVAALLEIAQDQNIFQELTTRFQQGLALIVGIILLVLLVVTFLSTYWMLLSIHSLKQSAALISQGNYDVQVNIKSRDEIEDLGAVFNQMSREIRSYVERVMELGRANAKFVPSQFLTFLGKDSITDIRLGDQVQREMTVLFSDIRAFTTLSERMTPEENFNFINRYLMEMGPVIRQQSGFIDKYIGDAIMALFPNNPEDALKAALAMFASLGALNLAPDQGITMGELAAGPVHIGIGIHTGMLMLGIIGEAERFDGTVISDTVNIASRLESLTKYYGAGILISGQVHACLENKGFFQSRMLDRVQVKGKTEALVIHEVLVPGLPGYEEKLACRQDFAQALGAYFGGDFGIAIRGFEALQAACPADQAIPVYLRRMKTHADQVRSGTWTGVTVLDSK